LGKDLNTMKNCSLMIFLEKASKPTIILSWIRILRLFGVISVGKQTIQVFQFLIGLEELNLPW